MNSDSIKVKGILILEQLRDGQLVDSRYVDNTVLTIGKSQFAGHTVADVNCGSAVDWIALGIGSATITAADATLGSEYLKIGVGSVTGDRTTTTVTNDTARFIGSFHIDATKAVNEAGLFNMSGLDTGSMYCRTCFADLNVAAEDQINATWTLAFA